MRQALRPHPAYPCLAATQIEVDIDRPRSDAMVLTYTVTGAICDLILPAVEPSLRGDKLWRQTCFEIFISNAPDRGYYECNFAPSTQWAAYRFSGHRRGMQVATEISVREIDVRASDTRFTLRTLLQLDRPAGLESGEAWRLGLSTIIEETSGRRSYWALAHPDGEPDFHHADCFALEFSPA